MNRKLLVCLWALSVVVFGSSKGLACDCQPPEADFTGPSSVYCGDEATFTDTSVDPDGTDMSKWEWSGGGYPGSGSSSTFTTEWCTAGDKTVKLKVWDNDDPDCCEGQPGCTDKSDTAEMDVTVQAIDITNVTSSVEIACAGTTVTFTATTSPADKCGCVKWSGGGDPPSAPAGSCTFETEWDSPGTKTVTAWGCGSSKSDAVLIFGGEIEPQDPCPDSGEFLLLWNPASSSLIENFKAKNPSNQPPGTTYKWEITSGGSNAHIVGSSTSSTVALKADQLGDLTLKLTYTYGELTCVSTLDITVQKPSMANSSRVCGKAFWRCDALPAPPYMEATRKVIDTIRDDSDRPVSHAELDETWSGTCPLDELDGYSDCNGEAIDTIFQWRWWYCGSHGGLICESSQSIKVAGWPESESFWTDTMRFTDGLPPYSCPMVFLLNRSCLMNCN